MTNSYSCNTPDPLRVRGVRGEDGWERGKSGGERVKGKREGEKEGTEGEVVKQRVTSLPPTPPLET